MLHCINGLTSSTQKIFYDILYSVFLSENFLEFVDEESKNQIDLGMGLSLRLFIVC